MEKDEFEAWKVCWQVNLTFHKLVIGRQTCIVCDKAYENRMDTRRSCFWLEGTRCSVGHRQARKILDNQHFGVCETCDQTYMLDVVKGKVLCRRVNCKHAVRVHDAEVEKRLSLDKTLLEQFLSLVTKYKVYDCAIHGDEVAFANDLFFAFVGPSDECNHDRKVCDACLKLMFESAIRGGRLDDLVCPDVECRKPIPVRTIRSNVSAEVFIIYNKKRALKTISQHEKFRWCPCGHGQIHEAGESNPEWTCLSCKMRHCYICRDDVSGSCEHLLLIDTQNKRNKDEQRQSAARVFQRSAQKAESERRKVREGEASTRALISKTTKICPKAGCNNKIERNEGCGHFTCPKCRTEFCWACKVIWRNGLALHLEGCKLATRRTVKRVNLDTNGYAAGWDRDNGYDTGLDVGLWLLESHR